jgi:hypothetical protein
MTGSFEHDDEPSDLMPGISWLDCQFVTKGQLSTNAWSLVYNFIKVTYLTILKTMLEQKDLWKRKPEKKALTAYYTYNDCQTIQ